MKILITLEMKMVILIWKFNKRVEFFYLCKQPPEPDKIRIRKQVKWEKPTSRELIHLKQKYFALSIKQWWTIFIKA